MKMFMILVAILLSSGCSNKKEYTNIDIQRRAPDLGMTKCEDIKELEDGSFKSVALKLQETVSLYYICEEKRKSLEDFINNK